MKKLILAITVTAFTAGAYADDCANKDKAACADKAKTAACCQASKAQCPATGATAKKDSGKKVVHSPKGEQQANKS